MNPSARARRATAASLSLLVTFSLTSLATGRAAAAPLPDQAPVAVAAANPNPAHAGDTVSFDGTGSYDAETPKEELSYVWSFPDGTTQDGYRVARTFDQAGVYDVVLTVSDTSGGSDTDTVTLEVDDTAPVAKATATPTTSQVGKPVRFDGSESRDAETPKEQLDYSWDVDSDGHADATGMTVAHTYDAAGVYKAKLTVTDPQGAQDTETVEVTVTNSAPTAAATAAPNPASAGQAITFDGGGSSDTETADNDDLLYEWDFGDGGTVDARGEVVEHAYPAAGLQLVTLTVRDPQGLSDTAQVLVSVQPNSGPTAVAKASPTSANLDDDIHFDGSESSDAETPKGQLTYAWDFGDGGSTTDATSAKAAYAGYATPGTKTATLTVTDAQGISATDTVQILVGNERPVAVATATPDPAKVDNTVTFDGTGSSDAETPAGDLRYEWDFGDGSSKATTATADHVYAAAGSYTVTLRVKDAVGAVGTDTITLEVSNTAPSATFTADPNPVNATQNVHLDATGTTDGESDRSRLTFVWDFGDGGETVDAMGPVVGHAYETEGVRQVTLTVTDPHGGVDTSTSVVGVLSNTAPTANATVEPGSARMNQPVTFDGSRSADSEDDADGEPLSYLWTFPGGATATEPVVTRAFASTGKKDVTLQVTDSAGLTDSHTVSVDITNTAPTAVAEASPTPAMVDNAVTFDGTGSSDAETPGSELLYEWDFGDGTPEATTATADHVYEAAGSYTVTLRVEDAAGAVDTDTITLEVSNTAPSAAFAATPSSVLVNRPVTFDGSSTTDRETPDRLSFAWSFGDRTTGTGSRLSKKYSSPGVYTARLAVTDPQGESDTARVRVLVAQRVSCTGGHVARSGSWRVVRKSTATSGSYCDNLGTGRGVDTLRLRAAGPQVALTFGKSTKGGIAKVYVDGDYQGRVNFRSTAKRPRFGYTRTFTGLGSGAHDVKLVMVRGAAYVDDFLVWGKLLS